MENLSIPEALSKHLGSGKRATNICLPSFLILETDEQLPAPTSKVGGASRLEPFANNKNSSSTNSTFWVNNLEWDALSCRSLMLLFWATTP